MSQQASSGSETLAWGEPPWSAATLPAALSEPLPARADVAVVGAGFTGLAAAFRLARRGLRVAVLEAGRAGAGASGRTGGIVLEETAAGALEGVEACIPALERLLADATVACDLRLDGCHELAHRADDAPPAGPIAWRDGDAWLGVDERVPGGTLDPGALVSGLARAAREAGATLHTGTAVRALRRGAPVPVDLGGGAGLACDAVLLATGAFAGELVPGLASVRAVLTLALATGPLEPAALARLGLGDGRPFYTGDLPYLWGRPLAGGRLVFGAGLVAAAGPAPRPVRGPSGLRGVRVDAGEAAARLAALEARVRRLHPDLAELVVERRWGGPVAFRAGGVPLLARHPDDPRLVVASAYAGHGVALSARVAELAADALAAGAPLPAWGGAQD